MVLDTAWTPTPGERTDIVSLRPAVAAVLEREDHIEASIDLFDAWAARLDLDAITTFRSVAWWHRRGALRWLQAHLQWRAIVVELMAEAEADGARPTEIVIPEGEATIAAAALAGRDLRVIRASGDASPDGAADAATGAGGARATAARIRLAERVQWRLGRHPRQRRKRELERRTAVLERRVNRLASEGPGRLLVLTVPRVHQRIGGPGTPLRDPFVGEVVDRLRGTRLDPISIALGPDHADDSTWPALDAEQRLVVDALLRSRWRGDDDDARATDAAAEIQAALGALAERADDDPALGGLGAGLLDVLQAHAKGVLPGRLREAFRIERLLGSLRPAGILLYNEYGRPEWLAGARWAGVPVFAVQHGLIYPGHIGYRHPRGPGLVLPARTFVFGPYEARVLRAHGGYHADEVLVTGSPRWRNVERPPAGAREDPASAAEAGERAAVRRELGVADGDRLLVISTTREPDLRRLHWNHALARLLDGPLAGVHLVFKQHPAERDHGDYASLVEGLARVGGHATPPVSVVRDVDLYRLLRAADAHLGIYSTVLTDAVATGTPNLVAATQARSDLLGYVAAGVATPVRTHAELAAAMTAPARPEPAARRAFLDDHFLPGDGAARVAEALLAATDPALAEGDR